MTMVDGEICPPVYYYIDPKGLDQMLGDQSHRTEQDLRAIHAASREIDREDLRKEMQKLGLLPLEEKSHG